MWDEFSFMLNVFVLVGVVIALKDRGKIGSLNQKVDLLERLLAAQTNQLEKLKSKLAKLGVIDQDSSEKDKQALLDELKKDLASERAEIATEPQSSGLNSEDNPWVNRADETPQVQVSQSVSTIGQPEPQTAATTKTIADKVEFNFDDLLKGNGLFWLGALVLAIGGVFLAKYSIEAGLLPPYVRVILGSLFGVALITAAEVVNKYQAKLKVNTPYISAALASGGLVTSFAMALISFDYYQFIPANMAFVILAVISLFATYLALRFGPILAGIGIIGAYAVPVLVATGSNNLIALLLYVSFVSLSAVWVAHSVAQNWLWWQSFVGHFFWFLVALFSAGKSDFIAVILFAVISLYLYVLVNLLGWRLNQTVTAAMSVKALLMPRKEQLVVLLTTLLTAMYFTFNNEFSHLIWALVLLSAFAFAMAYRHSALDTWPYLILAFALYGFLLMPEVADFSDHLFVFTGKYLFIQAGVVVLTAFSLFMHRRYPSRHAYLVLLVLAPLSLFGVSYVSSEQQAETYLYPLWAIEMLLIAAVASFAAVKTKVTLRRVTYLVLTNSMLALTLTMLLSASTLTLAIAAQVTSMSYLSWKYKVKIPDWIYKVAVTAVVARLTIAPWLAEYKTETIVSIHWTLLVYPVALLLLWLATKCNPAKALQAWFSGALLHILALFVTTETSYLMTGQYPNLFNLSYQQAVVLGCNWLILAGVYTWRSRLTETMASLYRVAAALLFVAVGLVQLDVSVLNNPFITPEYIGEGLINWSVIQWLLPAVLLYLYSRYHLIEREYQKVTYSLITLLVIFFINAQIRNYFNPGYINWSSPIQQAELYSYSIVWLVISTCTVFVAQHRNNNALVKLGFIGLALVLLKAFVIDMSNLEGLLRALSFIGLGLCLVGVGWLFQKVQKQIPSERLKT